MRGNYNNGTNLEKLYDIERRSNIRFLRSLAKIVPKKEFDRSRKGAKLLERDPYSNVKCTSDDLSKYAHLKKKGLNDLDLYRKNYKQRYSKKNVLGKMDCYCEQKIFEKYDRIYELAEKLKNDIKSFNKKILKKYGVRIIILGLLPFLGFVFNILFAGGRNNALINLCNKTKHVTEPNHDDCKAFYTKIDQETFNNIILKKYGVPLIILGLLPFLGFVFHILFKGGKNNALINLCNK
ncbi:Plasmodium exported protein, unknown function [Plasmodium vivax]|uniref:VIR protein n=1 Tax=Plasmodium vivax TaxID=5855 RepID=A0A565A5K3_PLAVI|nr:Plasmodium exported protein, unknown function [Plasmodium vivax]